MKLRMALLVGVLGLSMNAWADGATKSEAPPVKASDRIEVAPGMFGVSNVDAFEYVCDLQDKNSADQAKYKAYFDVDFEEAPGYRFAVGFVGDVSIAGILAAEAPVVSVTRARCPGLCLNATVKSNEDGSLAVLGFSEDPVSKVITLSNTKAGKTEVLGTCRPNVK